MSRLASARSNAPRPGNEPISIRIRHVGARRTRIRFSRLAATLASSPLLQQYAMTGATAGGSRMSADAKGGTQSAPKAPDAVAGATTRTVELAHVATRTEHDLLGERAVPADAYWGVHTLRAVENFPITGTTIGQYPDLIAALACVKQAAAAANGELGLLDEARATAIVDACKEIRAGRLHDQFVVDPIQGGAGTSTNMNANEVIANRALELLGPHPAREGSGPAPPPPT